MASRGRGQYLGCGAGGAESLLVLEVPSHETIRDPHLSARARRPLEERRSGESSDVDVRVVINATEFAAVDEPADEPTTEPTAESIAEPTTEPTADPTAEPTVDPTAEPTAKPTVDELGVSYGVLDYILWALTFPIWFLFKCLRELTQWAVTDENLAMFKEVRKVTCIFCLPHGAKPIAVEPLGNFEHRWRFPHRLLWYGVYVAPGHFKERHGQVRAGQLWSYADRHGRPRRGFC